MGVLDYVFDNVECSSISGKYPELASVYPDIKEPLGGYARFAGNGYVNTQEVFNYTQNTDFSISAWIRSENPSANYALSQARTIGSYASDWIIVGGNGLFWMRGQTMGNIALMNDAKWHHLVLVWNRSTERYSGYFDGINLGVSNVISGYGGITPVIIGARADLTSSFWMGGIAQVKIYRRQLSLNEVQRLHSFLPVLSGLYLYYPLVLNTNDYSQSKKHGILQNVEFVRGF